MILSFLYNPTTCFPCLSLSQYVPLSASWACHGPRLFAPCHSRHLYCRQVTCALNGIMYTTQILIHTISSCVCECCLPFLEVLQHFLCSSWLSLLPFSFLLAENRSVGTYSITGDAAYTYICIYICYAMCEWCTRLLHPFPHMHTGWYMALFAHISFPWLHFVHITRKYTYVYVLYAVICKV